jgi:serine phosphatase RsbU (regulator of sigma subunit)
MNLARTDRLSRWVTLAAFALALAIFTTAPILALSWSARPFPGFFVEQTLVVTDYSGRGWSGRLAGLHHPQRVTHLNDQAISTLAEFKANLAALPVGGRLAVRTVLPDGSSQTVSSVELMPFPRRDLVRLFWVPYGVGLAYLLIGVWVYRVRGGTRPGRAFTHFCVWTALATGLLFDQVTTHLGAPLWTVAIALEGGALGSLALLFPEAWSPVEQRPSLRLLPYIGSIVLAVWGLSVLNSLSHPWAYMAAWQYSYLYAGLGILAFLGMTFYRQRTSPLAIARQQARIILWGSVFAFTPLVIWLSALVSRVFSIRFDPVLFLPSLLVFPLAIGVAIVRYRLWDMDVIIRRTLVYGVLSAVLAVVYLLAIVVLQQLFGLITQQTSGLVVAVSTLAIAVLFNPLRRSIQDFIDRRFYRQKYDMAHTLAAFTLSLRNEVDLTQLTQRLETVIGETIQPANVLTWLRTPTGFSPHLFSLDEPTKGRANIRPANIEIPPDDPIVERFHRASGAVELDELDLASPALHRLKSAQVKIVLPLVSQGEMIGWLSLGPRLSDQGYSADDSTLLSNLAVQAAPAVRVAQLVREHQVEALQRERFDHEMQVARLIQQRLLPQELPSLPGWQVAAYWQPARAVGGDFYDFLPLADGRIAMVVGDVADKGIPAALVMASTRAILRGAARRLLSPGVALARSNELLHPEIPAGMFVTCLYSILDPLSGRLQFANAGHNLPYRRVDGRVTELRATGMPLGLMPGIAYDEYETVIEPGESLLLYSDGLVEAHNPQQEMFGFPRLLAALREYTNGGPSLIDGLLTDLAIFTGLDWEQEDDVTLLALQRLDTVT